MGYSGVIWVLWTNNVQIKILHSHLQFINMSVSCPSLNLDFFLKAVYGSPQKQFQKHLWDDLPPLALNPSSLWLIGGDFNAIVSCDERRGGATRTNPVCRLFKCFIDRLSFIDLGFNGHRFTWRRGTLMERLDRALCNSSFSNMFPQCSADHLPKVLSDHRPLTINLGVFSRPSYTRPFRFLAPWLTHPEFSSLVSDAWTEGSNLLQSIKMFSREA